MARRRLWLLLLLLAAMVAGGWYFSFRDQAGDRLLPVYVLGAERMLAGEEIYRLSDSMVFCYPPFSALLLTPFALLPAALRPPLWFAVNAIVLLFVLRWLHRWATTALPDARAPRPVLFWLLTSLIGAHHVVSVFGYQGHDLLILGTAALATAAWCRQRAVAGLWAGVGAAIKATPLLFVLLFAQQRRFAAAGLVVLAGLLLTLLPDLLLPRAAGGSWLSAWIDSNVRGIELGSAAATAGMNPHAFLNQSLGGTLARLLTPPVQQGAFVDNRALLISVSAAAAKVIILAAQILVLALVAWTVQRASASVRRAADGAAAQGRVALAATGAILCGMVLLSPQSSKTHFCVWLVPAAFLADRLLRGPRDRVFACLVGATAVCATLPAKGLIGTQLGNRLLASGIVTWTTVLLLLSLLRALRLPADALGAAAGPAAAIPASPPP